MQAPGTAHGTVPCTHLPCTVDVCRTPRSDSRVPVVAAVIERRGRFLVGPASPRQTPRRALGVPRGEGSRERIVRRCGREGAARGTGTRGRAARPGAFPRARSGLGLRDHLCRGVRFGRPGAGGAREGCMDRPGGALPPGAGTGRCAVRFRVDDTARQSYLTGPDCPRIYESFPIAGVGGRASLSGRPAEQPGGLTGVRMREGCAAAAQDGMRRSVRGLPRRTGSGRSVPGRGSLDVGAR